MGVLIMGRASATAEQMRRYIKSRNPSVEPSVLDMIPLYLEEGESEGVKGDIRLCTILSGDWDLPSPGLQSA